MPRMMVSRTASSMRAALTLACLMTLPRAVSAQVTCEEQAEQLRRNFQEEQALQLVIQCLTDDPNNVKVMCEASYLYAKCGNRLTNDDAKKNYFTYSKQYAAKALQLQPDDADAHYVMAIALGRMALVSGPSEKVGAARDVKANVDAALKVNPRHAGAWYLLGRWNYEVSNLNFAEALAAKYLFGGLPEASLDNALQDFQKAVSLDPSRILYRYDLACTYHDLGNDAQARHEIETLLQMKQTDQDDPATFAKARSLLGELKH